MKIHHAQFERHSWCAHAPWAHRDLSISHVTLPRLFEVSTVFRVLFSVLWIIWSSGSSWWMFRYVLARRLTVDDGSETSSGRVIGQFSSSFSSRTTEKTVRNSLDSCFICLVFAPQFIRPDFVSERSSLQELSMDESCEARTGKRTTGQFIRSQNG